MSELISKQAAIDAVSIYGNVWMEYMDRMTKEQIVEKAKVSKQALIEIVEHLPPAQPEIVRCKDCKHWNKGSCECREVVVYCQDYMVGDMETEAEHFCGYAERKEVKK